jgi:hypothetical protein
MQRIKINELVEIRRKKTDKNRKNFVNKLKTRVPKEKTSEEQATEEPRDYWVFSTSCIYNVFKNGNDGFYDPKIDELYLKMSKPDLKNTTYSMYKRNRDILMSFKEFEVNNHRPNKFTRQGIQKEHKTLTIEGFPLYVKPNLVFTFEHDGKSKVGALWLVPQVDGFRKSELGIFCEVLYRFLLKNYSDNYQISEDYCIAIDTFNAQSVTYSDLINNTVPFLLNSILEDITNS